MLIEVVLCKRSTTVRVTAFKSIYCLNKKNKKDQLIVVYRRGKYIFLWAWCKNSSLNLICVHAPVSLYINKSFYALVTDVSWIYISRKLLCHLIKSVACSIIFMLNNNVIWNISRGIKCVTYSVIFLFNHDVIWNVSRGTRNKNFHHCVYIFANSIKTLVFGIVATTICST